MKAYENPTLPPWQREMLYQYFTFGSGGVIGAWIGSGMTQSVEDVVCLLNRMNESLASGAAGWSDEEK